MFGNVLPLGVKYYKVKSSYWNFSKLISIHSQKFEKWSIWCSFTMSLGESKYLKSLLFHANLIKKLTDDMFL